MRLHDQLSFVLQSKLAAYQGVAVDETKAGEIQTILLETLAGFYPYDVSTGLFWLTAALAEAKDVMPEALAPFALEMAPLTTVDQLRFHLRQVGPFRLDETASEVPDDATKNGDTRRDSAAAADGDHPGDGNGAGNVHSHLGPDPVVTGGSLRNLREDAAPAPQLAPKRKPRLHLLD